MIFKSPIIISEVPLLPTNATSLHGIKEKSKMMGLDKAQKEIFVKERRMVSKKYY